MEWVIDGLFHVAKKPLMLSLFWKHCKKYYELFKKNMSDTSQHQRQLFKTIFLIQSFVPLQIFYGAWKVIVVLVRIDVMQIHKYVFVLVRCQFSPILIYYFSSTIGNMSGYKNLVRKSVLYICLWQLWYIIQFYYMADIITAHNNNKMKKHHAINKIKTIN